MLCPNACCCSCWPKTGDPKVVDPKVDWLLEPKAALDPKGAAAVVGVPNKLLAPKNEY